MHTIVDGNGRTGACADGNTGDRGVAAPTPTIFAEEGNCADAGALAPRGIPARRRAGRKGRSMAMTNAEYFRRQAATCLRLAKFCRDLEVARGLFGMAQEFKAKAAEIDADLQPMPPPRSGTARTPPAVKPPSRLDHGPPSSRPRWQP